jgi:hypothetical protein
MRLLSLSGPSVQHSRLLYPIAFLAISILGACEKVPLTAPTGSTVTLTLSRTSVALNDRIEVIATVIESSGTPVHNGTLVTFTGPLGRFDPPEARTVGGVARTTFIGTTSGTGAITAFSGGATASTGENAVRVGSAAAERITIRTDPATLPANGGTVQVIANVQDVSGNALPNAAVNFTVDNGTLSSNTGFTDANGEARVTLTTTRTTKIDANVAGKPASFTVSALPAPAVSVTGCTSNPVVGVNVSCTVTPTINTNGAPISNVTINWGDGTGDQSLGTITGATTVSHTYNRADVYTVSASATDAAGQTGRGSATVAVTRQIPSISITGPATGTAGTPVNFTVTPPNSSTLPASNVTVEFGDGTSRNLGAITGPTTVQKTYSSTGNYVASATVTDTAGTRNTASTAIQINNAPAITVTFTHDSPPANAGQSEVFTVGASGGSGNITNIRVTLDNGTVLYSGPPGSFTWTPPSPGTYTLTAVATDSAGNTGNRIIQVSAS